MPEIGETLRETRTRRRIDMADVESATKIRAKYLRALENEEWDLLPGPTFVKTFLRTYAEYLGLDSRLLVEEYRQRYERPSAHDLTPFGTGRGGPRRRRRSRGALVPVLVVVVLVAALVAALYFLGRWGQDDGDGTPTPTPTPAAAGADRVALRLTATRGVIACVEDGGGRAVLDRATLRAGRTTRTFRAARFRVSFSGEGVRMRVNGRLYRAAGRGYVLRPGRRPQALPAARTAKLCR
jgi:helix-turn-helix protein